MAGCRITSYNVCYTKLLRFNMHTIQRIGVIGAGAWGTALAKHLAEKGLQARLWAYERDVVESINSRRENRLFLPGVSLPTSLQVTNTLGEIVEGSDGLLSYNFV